MSIAPEAGVWLAIVTVSWAGACSQQRVLPSSPPVVKSDVVTQARTFGLPLPELRGSRLDLWATYYYLPRVASLARGGYPLLNPADAPLGPRLTARDWCRAAMEGSVLVAGVDGTTSVFNYAGTARHKPVDCDGSTADS